MLLQELWFGWFDAIYRKDQAALWKVVATTRSHDAGVAAMGTMDFTQMPASNLIEIGGLSILLDRSDCLVVEHFLDMSDFRGFVGDTTVRVLWPDEDGQFRFATAWQHSNDLWLGDCDDLVRDVTP